MQIVTQGNRWCVNHHWFCLYLWLAENVSCDFFKSQSWSEETKFLSVLIRKFNVSCKPIHEMSPWMSSFGANIYSYFEKGCRKKCTRQSCVGDFKCTVFQRNLKESYGRPLIYVCECWRKVTKVGSTATVVRNSVLIISHITFRDCRVHFILDKLSRNSCMHMRELQKSVLMTWVTVSNKAIFRIPVPAKDSYVPEKKNGRSCHPWRGFS